MSRVLIIGGGGFIGGHVVRAFLDEGYDVAVLDMAPPHGGVESEVDWITGSVGDATLVASAAVDCATVVFLANSSLPGSSHADLSVEVGAHVQMTVHVAEICNRLKVRRFLFASSGGTVYGIEPAPDGGLVEDMPTIPRNAYGVSKLAIEHYLRILNGMREMRTVSLRISNPYGEGQVARRGQGFIAAAMQHAMAGTTMSIWGDGSVERDFVHVSDVARAFTTAAAHPDPDEVINIGSGVATALREVVGHIEGELGRPIAITYHPDRPIDVHRNVLDISRARGRLGWAPKVELHEGIARTLDWWRTQA